MYKTEEVVQLKKKVIASPGDYIVAKGYLACKTGQQFIYFAKQGDTILVTTSVCENSLYFEAKSDVILIRMPEERSLVLFNRRNEWNERLMARMALRIQFYALPAKERLYILLFQMGKEIGISSGADCFIPNMVTQQELGVYINCTREYLCAVKRKLVLDGWIDRGKGWKLLDWERWVKNWGA
ncbi:Crp/Fnr family transcriptional regulator [Listeria booriae]|uniref:Crp/Fnr family transcriptional regulator n=1 Tax=Listeria booriae TaxID=1552123 RepID=A0A7X0Z8C2_9LIST|nr:Crp/Fnr family transcriptional regulator [Listeria booriae]MBC2177771.1 Crp/Fnr family transcriptional regulator [Listeria booriae]MBC2177808.1 Crp/Fnr family transcriptional regulator [Listeria booriae]